MSEGSGSAMRSKNKNKNITPFMIYNLLISLPRKKKSEIIASWLEKEKGLINSIIIIIIIKSTQK